MPANDHHDEEAMDDEGFVSIPSRGPRSGAPWPARGTPNGPSAAGDAASEEDRFVDLEIARRKARSRLFGDLTPQRRRAHLLAAVGLVLVAVSLGAAADSGTIYKVISLEAAGSFFSLAVDGQDLYAASFNSGGVLLERSTDMGADWAPVSVPYNATIAPGGVPWNYAVAAIDGNVVLLVAATGASAPGDAGGAPACGDGSTLLLAQSPNQGLTWDAVTETHLQASVSWMNAAVVGNAAAVTWVATTPACSTDKGQVLAMTSSNAGGTWGPVQNLTQVNATLPSGGQLEMAPGDNGIVVGFMDQPKNTTGSQLTLEQFAGGEPSLFQPYANLSVEGSWTLQGQPETPAFLLTPTYIIPLTAPPLTAIPFGELQVDGGGLGQLPTLTSMVYDGGSTVEVAAGMSQGGGVDCWQINLAEVNGVTQSCHVPLDAFLQPSSFSPPLISLLDGGGWWLGIGASPAGEGSGCSNACPESSPGALAHPWNATPSPAPSSPTMSASPAAVGVSVCWVSCASAGGLVAYYFSNDPVVDPSTLQAVAGAAFVLGGLWLLSVREDRRSSLRDRSTLRQGASPLEEPLLPTRTARNSIQAEYRHGLLIWVVAWIPVALSLFVPGGGDVAALRAGLVLLAGSLGTAAALPFHANVRRQLQETHGVTPGRVLGPGADGPPEGFAFGPVRSAARWAYASWVVAAAVLLVAFPFVVGDAALSSATTYDAVEASTQLGAGGYLLASLVLLFIATRVGYHTRLAEAASVARTRGEPMVLKTQMVGGLSERTRWGAALLPWNPFAGLILGWALQPAFPQGPYLLPALFLLPTLVGIGLLAGSFGRSAWAAASEYRAPSRLAAATS